MLSDKLLVFLFFLLPAQLGRHFWLKDSFIFGLKVDYLSPTFYLQDILIFLLVFFNLKKFLSLIKSKKIYLFFLVLYLIIVSLNLIWAVSFLMALFYWLRISELVLLGIVIGLNKHRVLEAIYRSFPLIIIFEFLLGLAQAVKGSSLNGIFWFLGERSFNILTPGIARADWLGQVFLRPYGTFSHPNSLAGFTLVLILLILSKKRLAVLDKIALILGLTLIVLCFSRTVWLSVFILSLVYLVLRLLLGGHKRLKLNFSYLLLLLVLPSLVFLFTHTSIDTSSYTIRRDLTGVALNLWGQSPVIGLGGNGFVISLARVWPVWPWIYWVQPVHNIYLLIASETGLIGLIIFLSLLGYCQYSLFIVLNSPVANQEEKKLALSLGAALFVVSFSGLFDHYWLTLIQNQLLLTIVISLSAGFSMVELTNDRLQSCC